MGNFGGDIEGLEERGFVGFYISVVSGNLDIDGGDGISMSGGGDFVGEDFVMDFFEVIVGEDEINVVFDEGEEVFVFGGVDQEGFEGMVNLFGFISIDFFVDLGCYFILWCFCLLGLYFDCGGFGEFCVFVEMRYC